MIVLCVLCECIYIINDIFYILYKLICKLIPFLFLLFMEKTQFSRKCWEHRNILNKTINYNNNTLYEIILCLLKFSRNL